MCGHGSHLSKQFVSQAYDLKKSDNVAKGARTNQVHASMLILQQL